MTKHKQGLYNSWINKVCFVIHWSGYCTVHVYALSFIDPTIVQSMSMFCHSLIWLLYIPCLCLVIQWSGYCTVHIYALSFIHLAIVQSMFMLCHSLIWSQPVYSWNRHTDVTELNMLMGSQPVYSWNRHTNVTGLNMLMGSNLDNWISNIVQSIFMLCHSLIRLLSSPCLCFVIPFCDSVWYFEWQWIYVALLLFVYICIVVGDPVIKIGSH
jgi:hypothetical protein